MKFSKEDFVKVPDEDVKKGEALNKIKPISWEHICMSIFGCARKQVPNPGECRAPSIPSRATANMLIDACGLGNWDLSDLSDFEPDEKPSPKRTQGARIPDSDTKQDVHRNMQQVIEHVNQLVKLCEEMPLQQQGAPRSSTNAGTASHRQNAGQDNSADTSTAPDRKYSMPKLPSPAITGIENQGTVPLQAIDQNSLCPHDNFKRLPYQASGQRLSPPMSGTNTPMTRSPVGYVQSNVSPPVENYYRGNTTHVYTGGTLGGHLNAISTLHGEEPNYDPQFESAQEFNSLHSPESLDQYHPIQTSMQEAGLEQCPSNIVYEQSDLDNLLTTDFTPEHTCMEYAPENLYGQSSATEVQADLTSLDTAMSDTAFPDTVDSVRSGSTTLAREPLPATKGHVRIWNEVLPWITANMDTVLDKTGGTEVVGVVEFQPSIEDPSATIRIITSKPELANTGFLQQKLRSDRKHKSRFNIEIVKGSTSRSCARASDGTWSVNGGSLIGVTCQEGELEPSWMTVGGYLTICHARGMRAVMTHYGLTCFHGINKVVQTVFFTRFRDPVPRPIPGGLSGTLLCPRVSPPTVIHLRSHCAQLNELGQLNSIAELTAGVQSDIVAAQDFGQIKLTTLVELQSSTSYQHEEMRTARPQVRTSLFQSFGNP